ncbi:MAG: bifunctional demethylmenaquinone methyltransferase/2-methoxy-6-polyprenyl-1,4-benzoquinol methylase UbiE [Nitrospirae bacterium]|nr:bifunctional demethylmenaquinone methyltransferase/2-methoxy-6-polyprenyl-1,4-benzoquinol methylase UbiE [Nitrospirota bacterium]
MTRVGVYQDKEQRVQKMFTSAARRYDLNNTVLSLGLHQRWKRTAVRMAGIREGDQVIDLCAGTADMAILLATVVGSTGKVVALDLNPDMLRFGMAKIADRGLDHRIQCVVGNMESLNFPDHTFQAATVGFGVRNTSDMASAFREMCRVLHPGGRGICLEFSKPTSEVLRKIYNLYSFYFLPRIGRWLSRDKTGIYDYLPDSIRRFPDQEALREVMLDAGFSKVDYFNLAGGIVAVHVGIK